MAQLLNIPREIRLVVYQYVFEGSLNYYSAWQNLKELRSQDNHEAFKRHHRHHSSPHHLLLLVCRQVYQEAHTTYCQSSRLHLFEALGSPVKRLQYIPLHLRKELRCLTIDVSLFKQLQPVLTAEFPNLQLVQGLDLGLALRDVKSPENDQEATETLQRAIRDSKHGGKEFFKTHSEEQSHIALKGTVHIGQTNTDDVWDKMTVSYDYEWNKSTGWRFQRYGPYPKAQSTTLPSP